MSIKIRRQKNYSRRQQIQSTRPLNPLFRTNIAFVNSARRIFGKNRASQKRTTYAIAKAVRLHFIT